MCKQDQPCQSCQSSGNQKNLFSEIFGTANPVYGIATGNGLWGEFTGGGATNQPGYDWSTFGVASNNSNQAVDAKPYLIIGGIIVIAIILIIIFK